MAAAAAKGLLTEADIGQEILELLRDGIEFARKYLIEKDGNNDLGEE